MYSTVSALSSYYFHIRPLELVVYVLCHLGAETPECLGVYHNNITPKHNHVRTWNPRVAFFAESPFGLDTFVASLVLSPPGRSWGRKQVYRLNHS